MAKVLPAVWLILGAHLHQAGASVSVTQKPAILATIAGERITVTCTVSISATAPDTERHVTSSLCPEGERGPSLCSTMTYTLQGNMSHEKPVSHHVTAKGPSAVYYCKVTSETVTATGTGTYIHVRDSGYVEPEGLRYGLIFSCLVLLLLSLTGTVLLVLSLFRKRQGGAVQPAGGPDTAGGSAERKAPAGGAGSLYMSLLPQADDVYNVMERETPKTKDEPSQKHQVAIHHVITPGPITKPQIKQVSIKETQGGIKPALKPKPQREAARNCVIFTMGPVFLSAARYNVLRSLLVFLCGVPACQALIYAVRPPYTLIGFEKLYIYMG
ncbi:NFAT activation molecule 1 [Ascaphus truei]|uniref:NFAT activation molecule 1 n=1 Tax=Ascaphus truei TaxID=8439 RepID=UPI003F5A4284